MSQAHLYRQWLKLCRSWGTDASKTGRDLGEYIRKEVGVHFKDGEMSRLPDPVLCETKLKSLERICNNKYYRDSDSQLPTSTGCTREEVHLMTSNEGLEFAKYLYDETAINRLKISLSLAMSEYSDTTETQKKG